jgi:hypothetical protein
MCVYTYSSTAFCNISESSRLPSDTLCIPCFCTLGELFKRWEMKKRSWTVLCVYNSILMVTHDDRSLFNQNRSHLIRKGCLFVSSANGLDACFALLFCRLFVFLFYCFVCLQWTDICIGSIIIMNFYFARHHQILDMKIKHLQQGQNWLPSQSID